MVTSTAAYGLLSLLVLAQKAVAQDSSSTDSSGSSSQAPNQGYNGGVDNPMDPSDAGAAGSQKGAFSLSKGGLIAIIVVIGLVVVLGVSSAVLFWLAKKRQWDVRQSLRRASRRLTGRSTADLHAAKRQNRRTGIRLDSPPAGRKNRPTQEKDLEKGLSEAPKRGTTGTTTKITSSFDVDTPTPKAHGWKGMTLPGKK